MFRISRGHGDITINTPSLIRNTPVGSVISYAGTDIPKGWLECDGSSVSRVVYNPLFKSIGTTYGSVDDEHFNLPDLRSRSIIGVGQGSGLSNRTLGQKGGAETHTLTVAEMPSHTHTGTTDNNGTHTHSTNDPGHSHTWLNGLEGDDSGTGGSYQEYTRAPGSVTGVIATSTTGITINSAGDHNHTFTSNSTGGGNAHNNMEPFMALRYIIRF